MLKREMFGINDHVYFKKRSGGTIGCGRVVGYAYVLVTPDGKLTTTRDDNCYGSADEVPAKWLSGSRRSSRFPKRRTRLSRRPCATSLKSSRARTWNEKFAGKFNG